jgi:hypothetical protein
MQIEELDNGHLVLKNVEVSIFIQHNEKGKYGWGNMIDDYQLHEILTLDMTTTTNSYGYTHVYSKELILKLSHLYRIKKEYINPIPIHYQMYKNHNIYYIPKVNITLNDKYYYRWLERNRIREINKILY